MFFNFNKFWCRPIFSEWFVISSIIKMLLLLVLFVCFLRSSHSLYTIWLVFMLMCTVAVTAPSVRAVSLAFVVCCCFTFLSLRFTSTRSALECDALPAHGLDIQHTFMILRKKSLCLLDLLTLTKAAEFLFRIKWKKIKVKTNHLSNWFQMTSLQCYSEKKDHFDTQSFCIITIYFFFNNHAFFRWLCSIDHETQISMKPE